MNTQTIKAAFEAAGVPVFVAKQRFAFRICTRVGSKAVDISTDHRITMNAVAISLGLTDATGRIGGQFNGNNEMFAYAPGAVRLS